MSREDTNTRRIWQVGIGLVIGFVVMEFAMKASFFRFKPHFQSPSPQSATVFPEPRLQRNPREDYQKYRRTQNHILDTYAWVDRSTGKVRVPISRAMEMVLQKRKPDSVSSSN